MTAVGLLFSLLAVMIDEEDDDISSLFFNFFFFKSSTSLLLWSLSLLVTFCHHNFFTSINSIYFKQRSSCNSWATSYIVDFFLLHLLQLHHLQLSKNSTTWTFIKTEPWKNDGSAKVPFLSVVAAVYFCLSILSFFFAFTVVPYLTLCVICKRLFLIDWLGQRSFLRSENWGHLLYLISRSILAKMSWRS